MKTAVVFCGATRAEKVTYTSWETTFGPADYFLITWDKEYARPGERSDHISFLNLDQFPIKLTGTIVSSYDQYLEKSKEYYGRIEPHLHQWALVSDIPGIESYDRIFITRTDVVFRDSVSTLYPISGKVLFPMLPLNSDACNDILLVASPNSLSILQTILNIFLTTDENQISTEERTNIHYFYKRMCNLYQDRLGTYDSIDEYCLVRPKYNKEWEHRPYSFDLFIEIFLHGMRWNNQHLSNQVDLRNLINDYTVDIRVRNEIKRLLED